MESSRRHLYAVAVMLLSGTIAMAAPSGPLWIDDTSGDIGTVSLSTGSVTVLGDTGLGSSLTDIAFTADGTLYATTFGGLYSINQTNGDPTSIGSYASGFYGINALVGDGSMLLAASSTSPDLYLINPSTFTVTDLADPTGVTSAGDLAFAPGGALYESLSNGELARDVISGDTVTQTIVGNLAVSGGAPQDDVFGLATGDDGVTYAVAGTEVYSVDLSDGTLTPVLSYSDTDLGIAGGTAFITEATIPETVPEPSTLGLLGLGALGLMLYSRRRHAAVP